MRRIYKYYNLAVIGGSNGRGFLVPRDMAFGYFEVLRLSMADKWKK